MDTQNKARNGDCKMLAELSGHRVVVGSKQLRKALEAGKATYVVLAENADPAITEPLEAMCLLKNVAYSWIGSKTELGQVCGIEVGAAAAAAVD